MYPILSPPVHVATFDFKNNDLVINSEYMISGMESYHMLPPFV